MNIVLADLPRKEMGYNLTYPSMAMTYLIGFAREKITYSRHSFCYLDGHRNLGELISALDRFSPDLFGVTISASTAILAYKTVNAVKERFPNIIVLVGGPHATADPKHVLDHCRADVVVRGEGEVTFCELIDHFSGDGKSLNEIDGISYRDGNGEIRHMNKRSLIKDLDDIPMPAWDCVHDFDAYPGMHFRKASPQSYILCSRGCPFDCNFCSNPVWKDNRPWIRLRSPEKIAQEVQWLYKLGIREIYLGADELNVKVDWAEEICDRIAALGHKDDLYFHIDARADNLTPRLASKMANINVWLAHLGIESGNQRTLDGIGKKVTLEEIIEACRMFQSVGIKVFGFLMLFHVWEDKEGNLNWETAEDVQNTINFVRRLFKERLLNYTSWQVATPYPGSRLWNTAVKHKLILDPETYHGIRTMSMNIPGVSEDDVKKAVRKGVALKTYYALRTGNINWREAFRRGRESMKNILGIGTYGGIEE
jgi:anaerobic magnesium-protoporphyrin IX monomethyl ester cyclase